MAVYFQFKSSTVKDSIPVAGNFISVGELKERIVELKHLIGRSGRKTSDIVISNSESKQDYLDDSALIPRHATVWARRVPLKASLPIIVNPPPVSVEPEKPEVVDVNPEDLEWDELLDVINGKSGNVPAPQTGTTEEDRIKALVETPALHWQGHGGGGGGGGWNTPPPGYICHRCKVAGHFIQHCPTNGDPAYDVKRVRPPTGIPKSMLVPNPDGSYALPGGEVAVLRPNEAAFDREMEGVSSSSRSAGQLPPELYCRLCKQVMKDAVLTSRCCFDSFCDRCIREHIISKCSCVCGATNVLADHLIPNVTLRSTIRRILEPMFSGSSGDGGKQQVVDSKRESVSVKESAPAASRESGPLSDVVEVQQKPVSSEAEKKKAVPDVVQVQQKSFSSEAEKKKALPVEPAAENYMMSMGHNPYWGGMQPGMNAFMPPYAGYGFGYGYAYGYGPMNMNMPIWGEQNMMSSGMGSNAAPPEVRKADGKRKRDVESGRDYREAPPELSEKKPDHHRDHRDDHHHRHRDHSHRSSSYHHSESTRTMSKQDSAYFPPEGALKKRKLSSSSSNAHYEHKAASVSSRKSTTPAPPAYDEDNDDDDDRNFKRRSSWSKSSPPATKERLNHSSLFRDGGRIGGRHY